jgi:hypothetical protein
MKIKTPKLALNDKAFDFEVYVKNLKSKIQISFIPSEFGITISRNLSDFMSVAYFVCQSVCSKPYAHITFTNASFDDLVVLRKH